MNQWITVIVVGLIFSFFGRKMVETLWDLVGKFYRLAKKIYADRVRPAVKKILAVERRAARKDGLSRLEEIVKSAELTNGTFFRSLELVHKNLESLLGRAEAAEQRLRTLLTQAEAGRTDQYANAAILLSEGKETEQVANMVGLSQAQVRLVQELRQVIGKERKATYANKSKAAAREDENRAGVGAYREKDALLKEKVAVGANGAAR